MTKRDHKKFKRNPRDLYDTPESAVIPLIPHLRFAGVQSYFEPCYGRGALVNAILNQGDIDCVWESDINSLNCIATANATHVNYGCTKLFPDGIFITNPPWERQLKGVPSHEQPLHAIIENLRKQAPTWLLFDADWMHTKQAMPYLKHCSKIVSVGRVSWMQNGVSGFDNCCWYLFGDGEYDTTFYSRI